MVLADSYQITSAFTGEQGIEIVRDENPDLDGLEVLEKIMAIPAPPAVVMMIVYPDVKLVRRVSRMKSSLFLVSMIIW